MPAENKTRPNINWQDGYAAAYIARNVRWKYFFRNEPGEDKDYIQDMYINSERDPDEANNEIEKWICSKFQWTTYQGKEETFLRTIPSNIALFKLRSIIMWTREDLRFKVMSRDKNTGLAAMDNEISIKSTIEEHLSDGKV